MASTTKNSRTPRKRMRPAHGRRIRLRKPSKRRKNNVRILHTSSHTSLLASPCCHVPFPPCLSYLSSYLSFRTFRAFLPSFATAPLRKQRPSTATGSEDFIRLFTATFRPFTYYLSHSPGTTLTTRYASFMHDRHFWYLLPPLFVPSSTVQGGLK